VFWRRYCVVKPPKGPGIWAYRLTARPVLSSAITDVRGVEIGHTTLIEGNGPLQVGKGPVRTGVTVILPRGKADSEPVYAGWFSQNGNGEMTGTTWIEESGFLETPITITNTHSVGVVRDAMIQWTIKHHRMKQAWSLPVIAETWDGYLNDINGFHVKPDHVFKALDSAAFSTANSGADSEPGPNSVRTVANERISPLFSATVEATEEAMINALVGGKTMTGIDDHTVVGLHDQVQKVLKKYNRLASGQIH
jgi:L-aminopeptidase/D-esterase-like protein